MFNSNILDVAIGMIFIYLLLSLMCSAANEMIELLLKKRAIDLERGIRELLEPGTDSGTTGLVQKLYDHALINNLFGGTYEESRIGNPARRVFRTQLPSYIPARNFALALMDLVALPPDATESARPTKPKAAPTPAGTAPAAAGQPPAAAPAVAPPVEPKPPSGAAGATVALRAPVSAAQFVVNVPPSGGSQAPPPVIPVASETPPPPTGTAENPLTPLRQAIERNPILEDVTRRSLITLVDAAGGDVAKARENIENWFNSSMDRVSGWYKRRAQLTILFVGLFVAIAVNVDTITVAKRLSTNDGLRDSLVAAASEYAKANAEATPTPTPTPTSDSAKPPTKPGASGSTPTGTPTPTPTGTPTEITTSTLTPTPTPTPTGTPTGTTTSTPTPTPTATPTPSPTGTPTPPLGTVTATPGATSTPPPSETPTPTLPPACVKDPNSDDCKKAKQLQAACGDDPDSDKCQREKDVQSACAKPDSAQCRTAKKLQEACTEPNSIECQRVEAVEEACKEKDSPKCKYLRNEQELRALGLPIGWDSPDDPQRKFPGLNVFNPGGWRDQLYWHWLGWLLTALAISLGAPFWFDLLNKFIVIRAAVKPHEKSPEEESKD